MPRSEGGRPPECGVRPRPAPRASACVGSGCLRIARLRIQGPRGACSRLVASAFVFRSLGQQIEQLAPIHASGAVACGSPRASLEQLLNALDARESRFASHTGSTLARGILELTGSLAPDRVQANQSNDRGTPGRGSPTRFERRAARPLHSGPWSARLALHARSNSRACPRRRIFPANCVGVRMMTSSQQMRCSPNASRIAFEDAVASSRSISTMTS